MEDGEYLTCLLNYIHLNPARASLVARRGGVESYPWSSLADYLKAPRKRRSRVAVSRGLQHLELLDTAAGRRRFPEWTEGCIDWGEPANSGDCLPDAQSLHSTFRRGWYFGGEEFREKLVGLLGKSTDVSARKQKGCHGEQSRDHGLAEAERIVGLAEEQFDLNPEQWTALKKGDWRKGLVAGLIRQRALIDNGWLAERLHMGARNAVSRIIHHARELSKRERKVKRAAKELREHVSLL